MGCFRHLSDGSGFLEVISGCFWAAFWDVLRHLGMPFLGWLSEMQHFGISAHHPPPCRVWDALTDGFAPRSSPRPWLLPGTEALDSTDPQVGLWPPLAPQTPLSPHDPLTVLDSCQSAPRLSDHHGTPNYPKMAVLGCCSTQCSECHISMPNHTETGKIVWFDHQVFASLPPMSGVGWVVLGVENVFSFVVSLCWQ